MPDHLKQYFTNFTISGLLGRIPEILARITGQLQLGALVVIFIGVALWLLVGGATTVVIYIITVPCALRRLCNLG
jgi:hypothetical protein